jgi:hypothetical protein
LDPMALFFGFVVGKVFESWSPKDRQPLIFIFLVHWSLPSLLGSRCSLWRRYRSDGSYQRQYLWVPRSLPC